MNRLRRLAYGLGWLALASCGGGGDSPTGPTTDPGSVLITFSSSISTMGAIQFTLPHPGGGSVASFAQSSGYTIYTKDLGSSLRVIMVGTFVPGSVATFSVPDRNALSSYTPTRESAADKNTFALYPASDFTLTLSKVVKGAL